MASPKRSIIPMIDINYKNFSPAEKRLLISSLAMNGMILIFLPRPLPKGFMFLKLLCPDLLKKVASRAIENWFLPTKIRKRKSMPA